MEQLHIENPLVGDLVETWIEIRRRRRVFEQEVMEKLEEIKVELTKFH